MDHPHRVLYKSLTLPPSERVGIKYWSEGSRIYVAAFDADGRQVSAAKYSAEVEIADDFYAALLASLIESLAGTVENDLLMNPKLHYVPAK